MKRIIFFLIVLPFLFAACAPANINKDIPTAEIVDSVKPTAVTITPTAATIASATSQPTTISGSTETSHIAALRTQ